MLLVTTTALAASALLAAYLSVRQSQRWSRPSAAVQMPSVANPEDSAPALVTLHAGQLRATVPLAGHSVADGVQSASTLHEGDYLWPPEGYPLTSGVSIWLDRATPFTLVRGSQRTDLRGHGATVAEALASVGVYLVGRDYTVPAGSEPLRPYQTVSVNRVTEYIHIEQETTSFETIWQGDPELELDQTRMVREGQEGVRLHRYRVTELNGEEIERKLEDSWVQQEPQDRIMAYGTKVVVRTLDTPQGPLQYWRRLRVLVTSYSPSTAGPAASASNFGITRSGKRATTGVVAVDPSVIPMGASMYVPGYGVGVAEDTGSAIIGRHIDVCYDDQNLVRWRKWVDVYLLTPVPPQSSIRWVLPNWPPEQ